MALAAWNTWFDKLSPVGKETVEETRRSPVSRELAMHKTVVCDDAQLFKNSFAKLSEFTRTVIQEKVAAEMPVGGYKLSGIGRENGSETLKHYTQIKAVYVGLQPLESPF